MKINRTGQRFEEDVTLQDIKHVTPFRFKGDFRGNKRIHIKVYPSSDFKDDFGIITEKKYHHCFVVDLEQGGIILYPNRTPVELIEYELNVK